MNRGRPVRTLAIPVIRPVGTYKLGNLPLLLLSTRITSITMKSPVLLLACAFSAVPFAQCYGNFHANVSVASKVPFVVSAAQKVIASDKTPAATYPLRSDANATTGNIYTLWPVWFPVSPVVNSANPQDALFFMADMDVDCDGTDFQCQYISPLLCAF